MIRIKEIRKAKKITAKQLADFVNVAESTMSLYENGKREPDYETLLKIADILGVTIDYLLGKTEKPADEGELTENLIIYHRDGKTVRRKLSKSQYAILRAMLDAIPEDDEDDI